MADLGSFKMGDLSAEAHRNAADCIIEFRSVCINCTGPLTSINNAEELADVLDALVSLHHPSLHKLAGAFRITDEASKWRNFDLGIIDALPVQVRPRHVGFIFEKWESFWMLAFIRCIVFAYCIKNGAEMACIMRTPKIQSISDLLGSNTEVMDALARFTDHIKAQHQENGCFVIPDWVLTDMEHHACKIILCFRALHAPSFCHIMLHHNITF